MVFILFFKAFLLATPSSPKKSFVFKESINIFSFLFFFYLKGLVQSSPISRTEPALSIASLVQVRCG
jgi:hypothetical protein